MTAELIASGVPGLDVLLGGGLPRRHSIVVTGNPGAGKTILCSQISFSFAARGMPAVIATVTSEPHDKLISSLRQFSFFDAERMGEDVFFVSGYPWLKKGFKEARDMLLDVVRERGARILFIDGLRSIRDLWRDEAMLREFLYDLNVGLGTLDCIALIATEYPLGRLLELSEATTVDGIVAVSLEPKGSSRVRRIEVAKLRGHENVAGEHMFLVEPTGIRVIPRLESFSRSLEPVPAPEDRTTFALPELDALLGGGIPRHSVTLVAGSTGIGKTLLGAHFIARERAMFLSFFERPEAIIERARRVGLDLASAVAEGRLVMEYQASLEWEADRMIDSMLRRVRELRPRRLVIDGLAALERSVVDPRRTAALLTALVAELRSLGVTTIFTKEVSKLIGSEVDFSDTPVTVAMENFLLLRYVELESRLHRVMSVLKMRDSEYVNDVREFTISPTGYRVLAPILSAEGLLTGRARSIGGAATEAGRRAR